MRLTTTSVSEDVDLRRKVVLVTGASSGIGRECARVLALRGARVLMACRNEAKAGAVVRAAVGTLPSVSFNLTNVAAQTAAPIPMLSFLGLLTLGFCVLAVGAFALMHWRVGS